MIGAVSVAAGTASRQEELSKTAMIGTSFSAVSRQEGVSLEPETARTGVLWLPSSSFELERSLETADCGDAASASPGPGKIQGGERNHGKIPGHGFPPVERHPGISPLRRKRKFLSEDSIIPQPRLGDESRGYYRVIGHTRGVPIYQDIESGEAIRHRETLCASPYKVAWDAAIQAVAKAQAGGGIDGTTPSGGESDAPAPPAPHVRRAAAVAAANRWRSMPMPASVVAAAAAASDEVCSTDAKNRSCDPGQQTMKCDRLPKPPSRGCSLELSTSSLIFYHIPKAGGGTVRRLLTCSAVYANATVCMGCVGTLNELGCDASSQERVASQCAPSIKWPFGNATQRYSIYMDHHNLEAEIAFAAAGAIATSFERVTILRDPLSRFVSL